MRAGEQRVRRLKITSAVCPESGPRDSRESIGALPSVHSFDDRGDALADADAHGCQAVAAAALLHFMDQRRHDARAAAAERVPQRNGAAVDVELPRIDA